MAASFERAAAAMGLKGDEMTQAAQLWEMMDDMAKTNPEGYQKFIAKQMADREKFEKANKPPTPLFGAKLKTTDGTVVWVNFCKSDRVQPPEESADAAIPVVVLEPTKQLINGGAETTLYEAVLHPTVCSKMDADPAFKKDLISVCLGCVEERSRKLDNWPDISFNMASLRLRETPYKKKSLKEKIEQAAADMAKPFEMQMPDSGKVGSTNVGSGNVAPPGAAAKAQVPDIILPGLNTDKESGPDSATVDLPLLRDSSMGGDGSAAKGAVVIEELGSKVHEASAGEDGYRTPAHTLIHNPDNASIQVHVDLPGVASVTELELDIETNRVVLVAPASQYSLKLPLPKTVDVDTARAKFRKKLHQLQITLPLAPQ